MCANNSATREASSHGVFFYFFCLLGGSRQPNTSDMLCHGAAALPSVLSVLACIWLCSALAFLQWFVSTGQ